MQIYFHSCLFLYLSRVPILVEGTVLPLFFLRLWLHVIDRRCLPLVGHFLLPVVMLVQCLNTLYDKIIGLDAIFVKCSDISDIFMKQQKHFNTLCTVYYITCMYKNKS